MERNSVFISYAREDAKWLEEIQTNLAPLKVYYNYNIWDDTQIKTSMIWRAEIENSIQQCKVAICLLSPKFLASKFIKEDELANILIAAERGGVKVFNILLKPCAFEVAKLDKFQFLNDAESPLTELKETECQRLFLKLTREVKEALEAKSKANEEGIPFLQNTLVLSTLVRWGSLDITQLQKKTGLKRKQVVSVLKFLTDTGLVDKGKQGEKEKPSTQWKASDKGTHFYKEFELKLNSVT